MAKNATFQKNTRLLINIIKSPAMIRPMPRFRFIEPRHIKPLTDDRIRPPVRSNNRKSTGATVVNKAITPHVSHWLLKSDYPGNNNKPIRSVPTMSRKWHMRLLPLNPLGFSFGASRLVSSQMLPERLTPRKRKKA